MDDNDMDAILTPERPTILHYEEGVAKDNPVAIFVLVVLLLLVVKFIRSRHTNDSDITPVLTQELRTILRNDVAYDQKEAEENCKFMWDAVSGLIRVMCEIDPLFNAVYTRLVHAGSYYEDLRITKADEFDLQIVLDFPFPTDSFTISVPNAESPFVTYQLNESLQQLLYRQYMWLQPYVRLAKFTDKDGFLSSEKVLQWIHGVMEQTLESDEFTTPKSVLEMTRKPQLCSCPAFTLEITGAYTGTTISVDLVPVLNIFGTKIPRKMHKSKRFRQLLRDQENVEWFLVPKPLKTAWTPGRKIYGEVLSRLQKRSSCCTLVVSRM